MSKATCIYTEKPRDILAEIAAQISHEFQKTPVQPATVSSQPGPHTLRGQETNFYALAHEQQFTITLLGQKIHLTATPTTYTWNYGDGTTWGPTPTAGAPLPDDRIGEQTQTSHIYTATGKYAITVTTHFTGTYSVNGGPALPIPGRGHIPSPPLSLTVWRAVTHNYADNCNENPHGTGC
ncbi:PKD domain-containing protein [Arthrobacter sp. SDTb3-6]|uniref:PKD domain-containing protein n=1 Tax=Arthrobacter sp. SDTb3-6 TaxID=2713571 RepID=UPI00352649C0